MRRAVVHMHGRVAVGGGAGQLGEEGGKEWEGKEERQGSPVWLCARSRSNGMNYAKTVHLSRM